MSILKLAVQQANEAFNRNHHTIIENLRPLEKQGFTRSHICLRLHADNWLELLTEIHPQLGRTAFLTRRDKGDKLYIWVHLKDSTDFRLELFPWLEFPAPVKGTEFTPGVTDFVFSYKDEAEKTMQLPPPIPLEPGLGWPDLQIRCQVPSAGTLSGLLGSAF